MVLVLPPGHRLARKKDISLKEIEHERFLITGLGKLKTFIDNILTANEISPREQIILGDRDAVKSAVNAGFGVHNSQAKSSRHNLRRANELLCSAQNTARCNRLAGCRRCCAFVERRLCFWYTIKDCPAAIRNP